MNEELIPWWNTDFGEHEIQEITRAIRGRNISQGIVTADFERLIAETLDVPYVVCTTSGSMALLMALIVAGVGVGDEVIVPNRTWIATAHAPMLLGAKIVLIDVEENRPIMQVDQLEGKITSKTRVIIPVHLNGRSAPMDKINRIASEHNIKVIEDAAQAFGARNASGMLGSQSFAGCFSLSVAKIISTAQGGFVVTSNEETYEKLKMIRSHGVSDLINVSYSDFGFNFKFTDIQASIGIAQIRRLQERITNVKTIFAGYADAMHEFSFLKLLSVNIPEGEIPLYSEVLCPEREKLVRFLAGHNIETRPTFPDLNLADHLKNPGRFPNSEIFGLQGLYLPCGPDQPLENIDRVLNVLRKFGEI